MAGILINHVELTVGQWIGAGLWLLLGVTPFLALGTVIGSIKRRMHCGLSKYFKHEFSCNWRVMDAN